METTAMASRHEAAALRDGPAPLLLKAGGKVLDSRAERLGWLTPTPADLPLATLKRQFQEQGYLWLKGLLDPAEVRDFRGYAFRHLAPSGLILAGSDPREGLSGGDRFDKADADRRLMALVRSAAYEVVLRPAAAVALDGPVSGGPVLSA